MLTLELEMFFLSQYDWYDVYIKVYAIMDEGSW